MTTMEAPEPAEISLAMSECMNLLFLFAAPRVFASVRGSGLGGLDASGVLGSLRRFLKHASGIRARSLLVAADAPQRSSSAADIERLVQAAMLVEEIAGALDGTPFTTFTSSRDPLPPVVVDRARRALSILGVPPPEGNWDTFEGFTLPNPPPSPQA